MLLASRGIWKKPSEIHGGPTASAHRLRIRSAIPLSVHEREQRSKQAHEHHHEPTKANDDLVRHRNHLLCNEIETSIDIGTKPRQLGLHRNHLRRKEIETSSDMGTKFRQIGLRLRQISLRRERCQNLVHGFLLRKHYVASFI